MIFNSISKELSNSRHSNQNKTSHQQKATYFPADPSPHQPIFMMNTPSNTNPMPSRSQRDSALSKMNQKITENIDYLRFKDQLRNNELRSSRASVRSNHSQRSHQSNRSKQSLSKLTSTQKPLRHTEPLHTKPQVRPVLRSKLDGGVRDNLRGSMNYHKT